MKNLFILLFLILLSSCAVKYGVNLEVQQTTYNSSTYVVTPIPYSTDTVSNGELKGSSFAIGITEETKHLITRINYVTGKVSGDYDNVETQLSESGVLASLGLKIFGLQPRLTFGSLNYKSSDETIDKDLNLSGFGVAYEIDLGKAEDHHIYIAFDQLDNSGIDGGDVSKLSLGYRFDFAKFRGSKD